jgi:hypothetical protein
MRPDEGLRLGDAIQLEFVSIVGLLQDPGGKGKETPDPTPAGYGRFAGRSN